MGTGILGLSKYQNGGCNMDTLALILSIIGSVNWGLVGFFQFDLVAASGVLMLARGKFAC